MRFTLALVALGLAAVSAVPENSQRIVGGSLATIEKYPYIVALLYSWNQQAYSQSCAGTILTNRSVLTAAHCTIGEPANRWRIRSGSSFASSGGIVHDSAQIINHPNYSIFTQDNDISIIRITSANTILQRPGNIAGANYNLADNQAVWASGWGATCQQGCSGSEQLRDVQVWVVNQNDCRNRYAELGRTITDNMLCSGYLDVGGRDQCQGDSGGPLAHNDVIVGVYSWGHGCGQARYPGVNARVSRYTTWISSNA